MANIIHPIDRSVKILAREYPEDVVRFVLKDIPLIDIVTIENPELNIPEKRTDFVYLINGEYILHLEFQLIHESDIPERMFKYNAFLLESLKKPVISVVIYLEKHDYEKLPDSYVVEMKGRKYNEFTYTVIKLWDYIEEIKIGKWKWLLPLLILLEDEKNVDVLMKEKEMILKEKDKQLQADLFSLTITIANRYFEKNFLFDFFKEGIDMLRTASIVEDWIKEGEAEGFKKGVKEGMEKGVKEGMEKGVKEGLEKGVIISIVNVLRTRFRKVPEEIIDDIKTINDVKYLEKVLKKAAVSKNLIEFTKFINSKNKKTRQTK